MKHVWEEIDQEGLDALTMEGFCQFEGMIFRTSAHKREEIQKLIDRGINRATIQATVNHQSLISYGGSIAQQRHAATLITTAWLAKAANEFPDLYATVVVESSPKEVLLWIKAVAR